MVNVADRYVADDDEYLDTARHLLNGAPHTWAEFGSVDTMVGLLRMI